MAKIDAFLEMLRQQEGSDLHLAAGSPPIIRIHGVLQRVKFRTLTHREVFELFQEIMEEEQIGRFQRRMDLDFAYALEGVGRFRVNVMMQRHGMTGVLRLIPEKICSIEELGLPGALHSFTNLEHGLVLVTGPTSSGKSTTLAALIDAINRNQRKHIVTVEDPIEFVHEMKNCLISAREVGRHTASFPAALRSALRQAADVIMVGEMRDLETISLAITCAETGCLVFGTLHINSAAKTIDRLIDAFPHEEQEKVRTMLSMSVKGIVAQQLLRRKDGKGRVAAVEIMHSSIALANLIRENKTHQIDSLIQSSDYATTGMRSMDQSILELLRDGLITAAQALDKAHNKDKFEEFLQEVS
jgi:twitching motility protein PilT